MLTIHTADLLIPGDGRSPLPGGAVLVEGRQIAAVEVYEELAAAHPTARVRRWPGVLTPGLVNPYGPELLEQAYHPDPREDLGSEPLTGEALESLDMTDTRWGASARRGVQRMLTRGVVAVRGELRRPAVIDAVHRSGLTIEQRLADPAGPPSLASGSFATALLPQAEATFAIFETSELKTCVATVINGRLLHRRR
ncbi:hypothetical protein OG426_32155 [Streptomyces canus]|uniref:imidazolonepropionase-like domain-containing protein n=1 Tax=Streptomyces canus TaxID=58343 RepID=UPI0022519AA3|nr:hypothetical protein [Streptomyces canus]MCX4857907.1 hypothetical protein [Streptomyces canus]WSW36770.1 hypothetical protein OG426_32155 [Streptomyces canus]